MFLFTSILEYPIPTCCNYSKKILKKIFRQDWSAGAMSQEKFDSFECDNIDEVYSMNIMDNIISNNK